MTALVLALGIYNDQFIWEINVYNLHFPNITYIVYSSWSVLTMNNFSTWTEQ